MTAEWFVLGWTVGLLFGWVFGLKTRPRNGATVCKTSENDPIESGEIKLE